MAETAPKSSNIIRCPVCLHPFSPVAKESFLVHCPKCDRPFSLHRALPFKENSSSQTPSVESTGDPNSLGLFIYIGALAVAEYFAIGFEAGMRGPEFLLFFGAFFLLVWIPALCLKKAWGGWATVPAFLAFEGLGAARYFLGQQRGMQKFGFLAAMMVFGGILMFVRRDSFGSGAYGGGCSSGFFGGCGSSCGGGGCGGGGCGGCGS